MSVAAKDRKAADLRFRQTVLIAGAVAAFLQTAAAQEVDRPPYFSSRDADDAIARALAALPRAKCGKDPCAPASTDEYANPPVETADARFALMTGAESARLKWCGLDWEERSFPMMMQAFQQKGIHDLRLLMLLQIIHNLQFARDYANLQALKTCTKDMRASLDKQNPHFEMPPWQQTVNNALLDQSVADMLHRVLGDIQNAHCGDEPCAPATAEEMAHPPISIEEAREAMKVGLLSGAAEFCGLDWQHRIFLPFISHHRHALNMSMRQLTIVGTLVSTMQGFIVGSYKKRGQPCTEELKQMLERHLAKGQ